MVDPRRRGIGAVESGKERDDLGAVQVVEKRGRLQLHTDDPVHLVRLGNRVEACHPYLTIVRGAQPFQHLERRGFPGAIWTEDAEDLARPDCQVESRDGYRLIVAFDDVSHGDDRIVRAREDWGACTCGRGCCGMHLRDRLAPGDLTPPGDISGNDYSGRTRMTTSRPALAAVSSSAAAEHRE